MNNYLIDLDQDLIDNTATRVPLCLCVDVSASMDQIVADKDKMIDTGETVYEDGQTWNIVTGGTSRKTLLLRGLKTFKKSVQEDPIARKSVEVCIVTFGDSADCLEDFCSIDKFKVPELECSGNTELGAGINLALDRLEERKNMYKATGTDYYQPILVILSDGENTGSVSKLRTASQRVQELVSNRKLSCFQIGIDEDCNLNELTAINPRRPAKTLNSTKFKEFFEWLSKSTQILSRSTLEESPRLPSTSGWDSMY